MIKNALAAAFVFLATGAASAQTISPDEATLADVRCLVIGFSLAGAGPTPEARQAGNLISIYYVGRVHGRTPDLDMGDLLYQQSLQATPESLEADRVRCGTEFQQVGRDLVDLGARMQARSAK